MPKWLNADPMRLLAAVAAQLEASGKRVFVAPQGLPAAWLAYGFDWKLDRGFDFGGD